MKTFLSGKKPYRLPLYHCSQRRIYNVRFFRLPRLRRRRSARWVPVPVPSNRIALCVYSGGVLPRLPPPRGSRIRPKSGSLPPRKRLRRRPPQSNPLLRTEFGNSYVKFYIPGAFRYSSASFSPRLPRTFLRTSCDESDIFRAPLLP